MSKLNSFPSVPLQDVPLQDSQQTHGHYRPVVLVVDDESNIANTLTEILKRSGYAAVTAYDAESALETALHTPPALLITDVILPGMSGIELAITIKRIFPDCKIVLFSGQASTSDLMGAARKDGHHFELLAKPLHPQVLLDKISEKLNSRKQQQSIAV